MPKRCQGTCGRRDAAAQRSAASAKRCATGITALLMDRREGKVTGNADMGQAIALQVLMIFFNSMTIQNKAAKPLHTGWKWGEVQTQPPEKHKWNIRGHSEYCIKALAEDSSGMCMHQPQGESTFMSINSIDPNRKIILTWHSTGSIQKRSMLPPDIVAQQQLAEEATNRWKKICTTDRE